MLKFALKSGVGSVSMTLPIVSATLPVYGHDGTLMSLLPVSGKVFESPLIHL